MGNKELRIFKKKWNERTSIHCSLLKTGPTEVTADYQKPRKIQTLSCMNALCCYKNVRNTMMTTYNMSNFKSTCIGKHMSQDIWRNTYMYATLGIKKPIVVLSWPHIMTSDLKRRILWNRHTTLMKVLIMNTRTTLQQAQASDDSMWRTTNRFLDDSRLRTSRQIKCALHVYTPCPSFTRKILKFQRFRGRSYGAGGGQMVRPSAFV